MLRDLITFNFHPKMQSIREYIDQVFTAAEFLGYEVGEQQLVDRILRIYTHPFWPIRLFCIGQNHVMVCMILSP
jgi:hypothetical protein